MFYRLRSIDERDLPAPIDIDGQPYTITGGGVLLVPPGERDRPSATRRDGYSVLTLFGLRSADATAPAFVAGSNEDYRWTADGALDVSRQPDQGGTRFRGQVQDGRLTLRAVRGDGLMPDDTELVFDAAPALPIPPEWQDALYFGPPMLTPGGELDEAGRRLLDDVIERRAQEQRAAAAERLARAWAAPA